MQGKTPRYRMPRRCRFLSSETPSVVRRHPDVGATRKESLPIRQIHPDKNVGKLLVLALEN